MRILDIIQERQALRTTARTGQSFTIVENPNSVQLSRLCQTAPHGEAKGLLKKDGTIILVWPAYYAHHAEALGLWNGYENAHDWKDNMLEWLKDWYCIKVGANKIVAADMSRGLNEMMISSPVVRRMFAEPFTVERMSGSEVRIDSATGRIVEGVRSPTETPKFFYHGTNMAAACMIIRDGRIRADNPVDDDDLGAVVCVTEREDVGRMFAVEFVRVNSEYPVGVVFTLDAAKVLRDIETVPYEAETAGTEDEAEHRVRGDIPLKPYCVDIRLVGDLDELRNRTLKQHVFNDWRRYFPGGWGEFSRLWTKLIRKARKQ